MFGIENIGDFVVYFFGEVFSCEQFGVVVMQFDGDWFGFGFFVGFVGDMFVCDYVVDYIVLLSDCVFGVLVWVIVVWFFDDGGQVGYFFKCQFMDGFIEIDQ